MQGDEADDGRGQRGGNLRIADIGVMLYAVDLEVVDFGAEGSADLAGGSGEVDERAAGVDDVDLQAVGGEPFGYRVDVFRGYAEFLAEFRGGEPVVVIRRSLILEFGHVAIEGLLLFGRALQLQQDMLDGKGVGNHAAVVFGVGFGTGVAFEAEHLRFVYVFGDERMGMTSCLTLRLHGNSNAE